MVIEKKTDTHELKVLIADDDAPTRMLLRVAISQWGYQVVEAVDGEEAWKILQASDPPSLLIIDWLMPKLDGVALCERIKNQLTHYPYTILLTQLTGTTNIIKGLEAGANEFLPKPFNMAELRSRLSVGARIVRYENELAKHNQEMKNFDVYCREIEETVLQLNSNLEQLNQLTDHLEKYPELNSYITLLKVIEINVRRLTEIIKIYKEKGLHKP